MHLVDSCSGKAAIGLLKDMAENPKKWEGRKVLFIHTGGLLGLFDKIDQMATIAGSWRRMDLDESVPRKDGTLEKCFRKADSPCSYINETSTRWIPWDNCSFHINLFWFVRCPVISPQILMSRTLPSIIKESAHLKLMKETMHIKLKIVGSKKIYWWITSDKLLRDKCIQTIHRVGLSICQRLHHLGESSGQSLWKHVLQKSLHSKTTNPLQNGILATYKQHHFHIFLI